MKTILVILLFHANSPHIATIDMKDAASCEQSAQLVATLDDVLSTSCVTK